MVIVCATDDNFVQHCCIMLVSVLLNNKDVEIYVLTEGLTEENKGIIRKEVERYHGVIHFCLVDSSIVEKFPMPTLDGLSHISRATYYRLLIADILPITVQKAIYLDCDIIVNHSIEELWNINIDNYALAASKQVGYGYEAERLGYPIEYGYFNAGVNMLNLDYFRKHNISRQLIDYIRDNYSKIKFHDQDSLNAVLYDQCLHIMPQWNMTSAAYMSQLSKRGDSKNGEIINDYHAEKENILKYRKDPIVLHYVSRPKPWQDNCVHPLYHLYYDYAKKTIAFRNIKSQNPVSRTIAILMQDFKILGSTIKQMIHKTDRTRL